MFLNITPAVSFLAPSASTPSASADGASMLKTASSDTASTEGKSTSQEFVLQLAENPLAEFVELPEEALHGGLWYSNVLTGVLRGALEMVQIQTECNFVTDVLRGDETTEIRVKCLRFLDEEAPPADD